MGVIGTSSSIMINEQATKPPLIFSKWPPTYQNGKSQSLRHQIFHQLRSSGRIPSPSMLVKRYPPPSSSSSFMMRPMKYAQLKKQPIPQPSYYRPTISSPPRFRFNSSPQASNGEYIFENPYTNVGFAPVRTIFISNEYLSLFTHNQFKRVLFCCMFFFQNKKKFSFTDETKFNPIHTVPAPNLNKNFAYATHGEFIQEPFDNQIFDQKEHFNQITFRPLNVITVISSL